MKFEKEVSKVGGYETPEQRHSVIRAKYNETKNRATLATEIHEHQFIKNMRSLLMGKLKHMKIYFC